MNQSDHITSDELIAELEEMAEADRRHAARLDQIIRDLQARERDQAQQRRDALRVVSADEGGSA